ncbi:MAG: HD domain-containing protein, partial [Candidatus Aminicenantes bacterium]|nr:HD domain-containing protein [Candidatus Aminicenantes bacterium]
MAYLIDGNNLLGRIAPHELREKGGRDGLVVRLLAFQRVTRARIHLVFDGNPEQTPTDMPVNPKFTIHYPGGETQNGSLEFANGYHGKVVPLGAATQLVRINQPIQLPDLEHIIPYALARDIDLEPDHVFQVCKTALSIFDQTGELHQLGAAERPLLEAGALLHDCGFQRGPQRHHKHSRDLILELELPGFSESEKKIVACVARYHRKAAPEPTHAVFRDLSSQE